MEFTNEEKEYIKKYEEKFHVLIDEEKEYITKYEKKYKDWIAALINEAIKNPKKKVDIANEIYEEVLQLGYDYGRDSADEDRSWEY